MLNIIQLLTVTLLLVEYVSRLPGGEEGSALSRLSYEMANKRTFLEIKTKNLTMRRMATEAHPPRPGS